MDSMKSSDFQKRGQMMELSSRQLLRQKLNVLPKCLKTHPRHDEIDENPIRRLKFQMFIEVKSIKNSQLKKRQITKNTFDRIRDRTNHSRNTN
ncbi:hypothetical protein H5410_015437 [Solanum commersonii]|uniref:Uncharacterized protein n=1 Tax=Solanum commersonii TaxID=4109 RepID=A0A9J5ZTH7_SOLCO|nr:hypothetical protein H5410_015437 [Solanum commersonii]